MPKDLIQYFSEMDVFDKLEFTAFTGTVLAGVVLTYIEYIKPSGPKTVVVKKVSFPDKIKELKLDEGLSDGYIRELIQHSNNKYHLQEIAKYLKSDKASNLSSNELKSIVKVMIEKFKKIDDKERFDFWIRKVSKGSSFLQEYFDYFI